MTLEIRNIIFGIEEYRKAYIAHRDPAFYKTNRYKPLISHDYKPNHQGNYTVSLYDTWVQIDQYKRLLLGKEPVQNSHFTSPRLQMALEELLNFTRESFMSDTLFYKIRF